MVTAMARLPARPRPLAPLLLLAALTLAPTAGAQQLVTDPAVLPAAHSCRVGAWYGQRAGWLQPSCHVLPLLDVSVGVGLLDQADGRQRNVGYTVRAKAVFASLGQSPIGLGLALGVGEDRQGQATASGPRGVFAYIPFGLELAPRTVYLHGNVGWRYQSRAFGPSPQGAPFILAGGQVVTWSGRLDVLPLPFLSVSGEAFGANTGGSAWQAALTGNAFEGQLRGTVSYGMTLEGALTRPGWAVGLVWAPPPLW